jgi:hypothetical protein
MLTNPFYKVLSVAVAVATAGTSLKTPESRRSSHETWHPVTPNFRHSYIEPDVAEYFRVSS